MATPNTENPVRHLFSLLRIARFSLLAGLLALGSAHASDISVSFRDGALTTRQEFAGTGYHSITLVNDSDQLATFSVARLHIGASVADYKTANDALMAGIDGEGDAVAATKQLMSVADALSGTEVKANSEIDMFVELDARTYVVSAYADGDEGALSPPTYASFTVTESGDPAAAPEVANVVHFSDFAFDFPTTVDAGTNLWEISNNGAQPHIAVFFKLSSGKSMADLETFLNDEGSASGPPPFDTDVMIDVEALSPGQTVYLPLKFDAGDWVAVCFVQDLDNPQLTHFMEGMIQEFSVI